jgi:hypothetical protein
MGITIQMKVGPRLNVERSCKTLHKVVCSAGKYQLSNTAKDRSQYGLEMHEFLCVTTSLGVVNMYGV